MVAQYSNRHFFNKEGRRKNCIGGPRGTRTPYLQISDIFGCEPNEVFSGQILTDVEDDFINDPIKETQCIYHQRNPNKVYCKLERWFTEEELRRWVEFSVSGIGSDNGN